MYSETDKIQEKENKNLEKVYHFTVKKVTNDYESMAYNTAISQMMIFINSVYKEEVFPKEYAEGFLKLLNPLAPHITEELWNTVLGHDKTIAYEAWPAFDESKTIDDEIEIPVQVNGKVKATIYLPLDSSEDVAKQKVHDLSNLDSILAGKAIVKEIYVKNRIYNIVVK